MTQEEKELLLRDLCARLPYGVMCQVDDGAAGLNDGKLIEIDISKELVRFDVDYYWDAYIDDVKPYLRLMSSMTEEEAVELGKLIGKASYNMMRNVDFHDLRLLLEFIYKKHLDYNHLIEKDLALEANKDMYK